MTATAWDAGLDRDRDDFFATWRNGPEEPAPTFTRIDDRIALFSGRYLDLAEVKAELARSGRRPALVTVWADVLRVPADTSLAITDAMLQLQARRLQIDTTLRVTIDFRRAIAAGLTVFCAEQTGPIRVVAVYQEAPPVVFTIDEPAPIGGVQVRLVDAIPVLQTPAGMCGAADESDGASAATTAVADRHQGAVRAYVGTVANGTEPPVTLLQQVYDLHLRALENPSAFNQPDPSPGEMTDRLCVIDDPRVLAELAGSGEARWVMSGDTPAFSAFDRTRLSTVRAWLDGADVPDEGTVQARISTRVSCWDRPEGRAYRITSEPLTCEFAYRVSNQESTAAAWRFLDGTHGYIEVDGVIDREGGRACFQPTPYAPWHVQVYGDGLDLTGVTRVVIEFGNSVEVQV